MKLRFAKLLLAASALVILANGCGRSGPPLPEPPRVAQCEPGKPGGEFTLAIPGNPRTFNPLFAYDVPSATVARLLFSSLVRVDFVTQQPQPLLAESWAVDDDQKTWTFKLRRGLQWSDGRPLTADDVVFTWNEVMYNPNYNLFTYELFRIGGTNFAVSKVDDLTVRVVTPEVFAPFLEQFGGTVILPKHILASAVSSQTFPQAYDVRAQPNTIVGSGPFRLKGYRPNKQVEVERNPHYGVIDKKKQPLPYFDQVNLPVASHPAEVLYRFLYQENDVFESTRLELWQRFDYSTTNVHTRVIELGVGTDRDFFWFNQNTNLNAAGQPLVNPVRLKWFREKKFRQAVSRAIDRNRIAREVYQGRARAVPGFTPPDNTRWHNPNIPAGGYNPDEARKLLAEIGLQDRNNDGMLEDAEGNPVAFTLITNTENPVRIQTATIIKDDLKKIGIQVDYQPVDFPALVDRVNTTFDYECGLMGLGGGGTDPSTQLNVLKSSAPLHQWFPLQQSPSTDWEARIDFLMDSQMHTLDFDQRKKYFDEVQAIWAEQMPMISTVAPIVSSAVRANIGNVRASVATPNHITWNVEELYFKDR